MQKMSLRGSIFFKKLDNPTCELQWETTQIELVMNEARH